jgi:hypothetical protein
MEKTYKLLFLILVANYAVVGTAKAQTNTIKLRPYVSSGVSIGNVDATNSGTDNFSKASYPSIEGGIMGNNVSLGVVLGCENFFVTPNSRLFYELKTSISVPIGKFSGYALFGTGAYFEKKFNNFIEYGVGFSYMPKNLGYFVQFSNWARSNYVSVGTTYAF